MFTAIPILDGFRGRGNIEVAPAVTYLNGFVSKQNRGFSSSSDYRSQVTFALNVIR
jgi:hypothetical protein